MMRVFVTTLGCRLNDAEIAMWRRELRRRGHGVVQRPDQANVCVLNTCAVTSEAARKSRKLARRIHRENPTAKLVLTGCFAALEPAAAAALEGVDHVVSNADKEKLVDVLESELDLTTTPAAALDSDEAISTHLYRATRDRAFVKIQDGCRNRCTFCIVTIARGQERSRTVEDLVAEITSLCDQGFAEVVLTGVHIGGYGRDLSGPGRAVGLVDLIGRILDETKIPRLRIGSLEPWDIPDDFFSLWRDDRLLPHLHLPLQSGSDTVLRRMARRCSTAQFSELVGRAQAAIPRLNITTDLIVGFPGETEAEFRETLDYVATLDLGHVHLFSYSAREGTKAARLPGQVANAKKRSRAREVAALATSAKTARLQREVGESDCVLWEGQGEPTDDGRVRWTGYTRNYFPARCITSGQRDLGNCITPVHLDAVGAEQTLEATLRC